MPFVVADVGILNPCQWFEEGSFLWYWNLCWLPFSALELALMAAAFAASVVLVLRRVRMA